jgi:hypothetical protein
MKFLSRIEIFQLACFKKHFKRSENMQNDKIQPVARQKIKNRKRNNPFIMANTWHHSLAQARTRAQTCIHMRTCTNTQIHTQSLSGIFEGKSEGRFDQDRQEIWEIKIIAELL